MVTNIPAGASGSVPGLWDTAVYSYRWSMEKKKGFFRSTAGSRGFMGSNLVARVDFICLLLWLARCGTLGCEGSRVWRGHDCHIPRSPSGISESQHESVSPMGTQTRAGQHLGSPKTASSPLSLGTVHAVSQNGRLARMLPPSSKGDASSPCPNQRGTM